MRCRLKYNAWLRLCVVDCMHVYETDWTDELQVPYLNWNGDKRKLNANRCDNEWNEHNRFLFVRKQYLDIRYFAFALNPLTLHSENFYFSTYYHFSSYEIETILFGSSILLFKQPSSPLFWISLPSLDMSVKQPWETDWETKCRTKMKG